MASFEESLKKLESIVEILEKGDLSLEDSIKLFEEGTVLSAVCAMVPGLSAMWYLAGAMFVALGAYTALLVHMRNVTAEREMKLRFLPSGSSNEAAPAPAYAMRRSAN